MGLDTRCVPVFLVGKRRTHAVGTPTTRSVSPDRTGQRSGPGSTQVAGAATGHFRRWVERERHAFVQISCVQQVAGEASPHRSQFIQARMNLGGCGRRITWFSEPLNHWDGPTCTAAVQRRTEGINGDTRPPCKVRFSTLRTFGARTRSPAVWAVCRAADRYRWAQACWPASKHNRAAALCPRRPGVGDNPGSAWLSGLLGEGIRRRRWIVLPDECGSRAAETSILFARRFQPPRIRLRRCRRPRTSSCR